MVLAAPSLQAHRMISRYDEFATQVYSFFTQLFGDDLAEEPFLDTFLGTANISATDPRLARVNIFRLAYDRAHDVVGGKSQLASFNLMPLDDKVILLLRDDFGFSYQEIGAIMDLSHASVTLRVYRAREEWGGLLKHDVDAIMGASV